jgi:YggT family protein
MAFLTLDLVARSVVVLALAYACVIGLTHWAVRSRRLTPFGAWPRFVRRASDPLLLPLERRVIRAGGSPQDAPLWLIGLVIAGGLLLLTLVHWLTGFVATLGYLADAGPRASIRFAVSTLFSVLMIALFIRVISSWFGISPYGKWMRPVVVLTDWLLAPIRRILPPFGMLDLSPLLAWLLLTLLRGFVLSYL